MCCTRHQERTWKFGGKDKRISIYCRKIFGANAPRRNECVSQLYTLMGWNWWHLPRWKASSANAHLVILILAVEQPDYRRDYQCCSVVPAIVAQGCCWPLNRWWEWNGYGEKCLFCFVCIMNRKSMCADVHYPVHRQRYGCFIGASVTFFCSGSASTESFLFFFVGGSLMQFTSIVSATQTCQERNGNGMPKSCQLLSMQCILCLRPCGCTQRQRLYLFTRFFLSPLRICRFIFIQFGLFVLCMCHHHRYELRVANASFTWNGHMWILYVHTSGWRDSHAWHALTVVASFNSFICILFIFASDLLVRFVFA